MTDIRENPAPLQAEPASPSEVAGLNARTARRQRLLLGGVGALALAGGSWFILGGDDSKTAEDAQAAQTIDTAGLVNRDLSQREFVASYGNRLDAVTREQKALKETAAPRSEVEAQLAALKAENQAMRVDGQAAIDAISAENADLKSRLAAQAAAPAPSAPAPAYGPQAGGYDARGRAPTAPQPGSPTAGADGTVASPGEVKLMSFTSDKAGASGLRAARPEAPPVVVEDSPDYLPPNSYAPARVIVGVDASAGVASQTDPLPVVLRITGPARSVMQNGKVLTTRIQGCVVNGASRRPAAISTTPSSITVRGPVRSISRPISGLRIADTRKPNENAPAVMPRSQPNSSMIGAKKSENDVRAFTPMPMVMKVTATMIQP